MFHGLSDGLIPTRSSLVFYNRTAEAVGGTDKLTDWFRFFLVPGMQHVKGTAVDAPWYFAQANAAAALGTDIYSVPGFEDAQHDALLALMAWVETDKGRIAPSQIIATTWVNSTDFRSGVLRQRPLCPWPKTAVYGGVGDVDCAQSWQCSG
jgi:feruloyl esterase